jgi:succinate dehydrogenase/fumarate reductase cytochrome b subunit
MEARPNHVLRNNLLGLLLAAVVLGVLAPVTDSGSIILFAFGYLLQAVINLILGVVYIFKHANNGKSAAPYFLSAVLVLLIGFGACSGMFMLGGTLGNMR